MVQPPRRSRERNWRRCGDLCGLAIDVWAPRFWPTITRLSAVMRSDDEQARGAAKHGTSLISALFWSS